MERTFEKCSYCGKESQNLIKIGPKLRFCDYSNCYAKHCLKNNPGTSLAEIVSEIFPNALDWVND